MYPSSKAYFSLSRLEPTDAGASPTGLARAALPKRLLFCVILCCVNTFLLQLFSVFNGTTDTIFNEV